MKLAMLTATEAESPRRLTPHPRSEAPDCPGPAVARTGVRF